MSTGCDVDNQRLDRFMAEVGPLEGNPDIIVLHDEPEVAGYERTASKLSGLVTGRRARILRRQELSNGTIRRFPGKHFQLVKELSDLPKPFFDTYRVSPALKAVQIANQKVPIADYIAFPLDAVFDGKKVHELLREWIQVFKEALRSDEIKRLKANINITESRRRDSIKKVLSTALNQYRRLRIARLDLSYKRDSRYRKEISDLESDYRRFVNNMRMNSSLTKGMLIMINKIEYAVEKGFHIHVLLVFDGDVIRNEAFRCELFGDYWVERITSGEGIFFNGNRKRAKELLAKYLRVNEQDIALGEVSVSSKKKILQLENVIRYFSKYEQSALISIGQRRKDIRIVTTPEFRARSKLPKRVKK